MRLITIASAALLAASTMACASTPRADAKAPEPIAYDPADFTPPSDLDVQIGGAPAQGLASKRSAPNENAYGATYFASRDRKARGDVHPALADESGATDAK